MRKKKRHDKKSSVVTFGPAQIELLRTAAQDHFVTIRLGEILGSRRKFRSYHVMFEAGSVRLLNWWPASGKTWCPLDGAKGMAFDCFAALDRSVDIAMELPATEEEEAARLDSIDARYA